MTDNQFAVILFGLIAGYWIVSRLLSGKRDSTKANRPTDQEADARGAAGPERPISGRSWSEVLGVASSAGLDEIRHAYKEMIVQYHPDKVASLGRELRELAEMKSKEITMAYGEAMRARGFDK